MEDKNRNHLLDNLRQLEDKGYSDQLRFEDGSLLNCANQQKYSPGDIKTVDERRFEGMSNPSDMSILFIIEFKDGRKGTIAAPYGARADAELFEFMTAAQN